MKYKHEVSSNCSCYYFGFPLLGFTLSFVRIFKGKDVNGMPHGPYKVEAPGSVLYGFRLGQFSASIFFFKN